MCKPKYTNIYIYLFKFMNIMGVYELDKEKDNDPF